jgi:hypothetical protein
LSERCGDAAGQWPDELREIDDDLADLIKIESGGETWSNGLKEALRDLLKGQCRLERVDPDLLNLLGGQRQCGV